MGSCQGNPDRISNTGGRRVGAKTIQCKDIEQSRRANKASHSDPTSDGPRHRLSTDRCDDIGRKQRNLREITASSPRRSDGHAEDSTMLHGRGGDSETPARGSLKRKQSPPDSQGGAGGQALGRKFLRAFRRGTPTKTTVDGVRAPDLQSLTARFEHGLCSLFEEREARRLQKKQISLTMGEVPTERHGAKMDWTTDPYGASVKTLAGSTSNSAAMEAIDVVDDKRRSPDSTSMAYCGDGIDDTNEKITGDEMASSTNFAIQRFKSWEEDTYGLSAKCRCTSPSTYPCPVTTSNGRVRCMVELLNRKALEDTRSKSPHSRMPRRVRNYILSVGRKTELAKSIQPPCSSASCSSASPTPSSPSPNRLQYSSARTSLSSLQSGQNRAHSDPCLARFNGNPNPPSSRTPSRLKRSPALSHGSHDPAHGSQGHSNRGRASRSVSPAYASHSSAHVNQGPDQHEENVLPSKSLACPCGSSAHGEIETASNTRKSTPCTWSPSPDCPLRNPSQAKRSPAVSIGSTVYWSPSPDSSLASSTIRLGDSPPDLQQEDTTQREETRQQVSDSSCATRRAPPRQGGQVISTGNSSNTEVNSRESKKPAFSKIRVKTRRQQWDCSLVCRGERARQLRSFYERLEMAAILSGGRTVLPSHWAQTWRTHSSVFYPPSPSPSPCPASYVSPSSSPTSPLPSPPSSPSLRSSPSHNCSLHSHASRHRAASKSSKETVSTQTSWKSQSSTRKAGAKGAGIPNPTGQAELPRARLHKFSQTRRSDMIEEVKADKKRDKPIGMPEGCVAQEIDEVIRKVISKNPPPCPLVLLPIPVRCHCQLCKHRDPLAARRAGDSGGGSQYTTPSSSPFPVPPPPSAPSCPHGRCIHTVHRCIHKVRRERRHECDLVYPVLVLVAVLSALSLLPSLWHWLANTALPYLQGVVDSWM